MRGYVQLKTTIGEGQNSRTLNVRYMFINAYTSYNIILGRSLWSSGILSTLDHEVSTGEWKSRSC